MTNEPRDQSGTSWMNRSLPAEDRVALWLTEQGYNLEFETRDLLAKAGYETLLGEYAHQQDGASLEIDVLAWASRRVSLTEVRVGLVVECKFAPEPWVVFVEDGTSPTPRALESELGLLLGYVRRVRGETWSPPQFACATRARSITAMRAKGKGSERDLSYEALTGVLARAESVVGRLGPPFGRLKPPAVSALVRPVIVVRGDLCAVEWDSGSKSASTRAIDSATVSSLSETGSRVEVDVVRIDAFPAYLANIGNSVAEFLDKMGATAELFDAAWSQRKFSALGLPDSEKTRLPTLLAQLADEEATFISLQEQKEFHAQSLAQSLHKQRL